MVPLFRKLVRCTYGGGGAGSGSESPLSHVDISYCTKSPNGFDPPDAAARVQPFKPSYGETVGVPAQSRFWYTKSDPAERLVHRS